jgi:hypothetical protein
MDSGHGSTLCRLAGLYGYSAELADYKLRLKLPPRDSLRDGGEKHILIKTIYRKMRWSMQDGRVMYDGQWERGRFIKGKLFASDGHLFSQYN